MIPPQTRYALSVLLACSRALAGQVTPPASANRNPSDYAAVASSDARSIQTRVAQLVAKNVVARLGDCGNLAAECRGLKSRGSEPEYSARLLDPQSYVALLPNEVTIRGVPYYAWLPVEEVPNGAAVRARWRQLATDHVTLGCQDSECTVIILQPPDARHSTTSISACNAEGSVGYLDVPKRCDVLAVISGERSWLRTLIGWGSASVAAELGPSPLVEDYVVEESLSILQLPDGKRGAVVVAVERALSASPLLLITEVRPPVNPSAVKGRRASAESEVIRDFREWANVRADVDPAVKGAGDTTVSTVELTTILWLSRTASPTPTRPASATESGSYHARVRSNVMREIGQVCDGAFVGSRIVCK